MNSGKAQLTKDLNIASKKIPADTIIKNGKILDVFNLEWIEADVAISDGKFVGIGHYNEAARIIDAKNRYVCPPLLMDTSTLNLLWSPRKSMLKLLSLTELPRWSQTP